MFEKIYIKYDVFSNCSIKYVIKDSIKDANSNLINDKI